MVALLFSTGQHHKGTQVLIQHTVAVSPKADRAKMLKWATMGNPGFDEDGLLAHWNLENCKISTLPGSFSALVCTGGLWLEANLLKSLPANFGQLEVGGNLNLNHNQLASLPANFGELEVGGNLNLDNNQLESLPEGFENISVGGNLKLYDNQLAQQPCTFPNVQGKVFFNKLWY